MAAMFTRIQHDLLKDRIDATFYSPEFVANEERLKRSEVGIGRLKFACKVRPPSGLFQHEHPRKW